MAEEKSAAAGQQPDYASLMPELNVKDGLSRLMNNKKLFLRLLNTFKGRAMTEELIESVKSGDFTKIAAAAHALKGVAANLGLGRLRAAAADIEAQAKAGTDPAQLLEELSSALDATEQGMKRLMEWEGIV